MKHTQLPWYEGRTGNHQGIVISENTGENIVISYHKKYAEFIVRACNAHDDLLEACNELIDAWHSDDANFHIEEPKALKLARKAIAKATKEDAP